MSLIQKENKIRVALIGHGHLGKWHAQKILSYSQAVLTAIVETKKQSHQSLRALYPQALITENLSEALSEVDAAVVVAPTSYHFEICQQVLLSKTHLFCEKPLCSDPQQAKQLKELALLHPELVIQVGHSERFHQVWEELREVFSSLKNAAIEIQRTSAFKGRATDVDVVQDLMIHDIDLLRYLFQDEIVDIQAVGVKNLTSNWDLVNAFFKLEKGHYAFISSSRNSCSEQRSLRVSHSEGEHFVDLMNCHIEFRNSKGEREIQKDYPKRDHLLLEHQAFYSAIEQQHQPVVSLDDGIAAVTVMSRVLDCLE